MTAPISIERERRLREDAWLREQGRLKHGYETMNSIGDLGAVMLARFNRKRAFLRQKQQAKVSI